MTYSANKIFVVICFISILGFGCSNAQDRQLNPNCEGCDALYEYGKKKLLPIDTLPEFDAPGQKIKVTGTVYSASGSPAEGIILYVYHTNPEGIYPKKGNENGWAKRHGFLRGWVKTDHLGRYTFYTKRPASYPNTTVSQHIHLTVKEPGIEPYWLDSYLFADDPNLNPREESAKPRGGSGILTLRKEGSIWVGKRDIYLGKNIPNY